MNELCLNKDLTETCINVYIYMYYTVEPLLRGHPD